MENTTYFAACLVAALAIIAVISAVLARHKEHHDARRLQALRMVQALDRYAAWVSAQRLAALFHGESHEASTALDQASSLRLAHFPELAPDMNGLLAVHNRLAAFLAAQQALWLRDPERWLASDHDRRFMALWHEHQMAMQTLGGKLKMLATVRRRTARTDQSTYA